MLYSLTKSSKVELGMGQVEVNGIEVATIASVVSIQTGTQPIQLKISKNKTFTLYNKLTHNHILSKLYFEGKVSQFSTNGLGGL